MKQPNLLKISFFETAYDWKLRFETINKEKIVVYIQCQRPLILWSNEFKPTDFANCAQEDFSLLLTNGRAPQIVTNIFIKPLLVPWATFHTAAANESNPPKEKHKFDPQKNSLNNLPNTQTQWCLFYWERARVKMGWEKRLLVGRRTIRKLGQSFFREAFC